MPLPQTATDDAWQQTLERLGMQIQWSGSTDLWTPRHNRADQRQGTAARDALRALLFMGAYQPFPLIHSWSPRGDWRDEWGGHPPKKISGPHRFEGWKVTGCVIEAPGTDQETYVFSLGTFSPPSARDGAFVGHIEEHLVFPPERADYERRQLPLLGVEFFEFVQLDLPSPAQPDPQDDTDGRKVREAKAARNTR